MKLPITARLARSGATVFTELDDQVVMLDTAGEKYYELEPVASRKSHQPNDTTPC